MDFFKNLIASPSAPPPEPVTVMAKTIHPYYPTEIDIANFAANEMSVPQLLATFAAGCTIILSLTWFLTSSLAPRLRVGEKATVLWFCLCGFIHLFFEGYFAYNHTRMGGLQDIFGQLWKEYSLSDSRYLTSDPFVLCMETITAVFWGPLSFLMVYFIIVSHPLRYPLQAIVSLGQIYGDILYFATSMFDHYHKKLTYCRPEPYYFWFYYFLMNIFWIVIPANSPHPSGLYESPSVQDRIRQWQAQGAANALAPDAVSVRSIPISECPSTISKPESEHGNESKVRVGGRSGAKNEEDQDRGRSSSAPRRRIISDGHWKTQKQTKQDKDAKVAADRRAESRAYDLSYTSNQEKSKVKRQSRMQQRPRVGQSAEQTSPYDDGIRVAPIPDDGQVREEGLQPAYDLESRADEELARHLTTDSVFSGDFGGDSHEPTGREDDVPGDWRPSKYAELLGRTGDDSLDGEVPKSRKGGLLGKTRGMFIKSETMSPASNRLPSIEAWLDEQPDPFTDKDGVDDLPPVEMPQPLRKRAHRKRPSTEKSIAPDPNQIWDSISPEQNEPSPLDTPRRDGSVPSSNANPHSSSRLSDAVNEAQDANDGSPSNLRRRGARVRRQRGAVRKDIIPGEGRPEPAASLAEGPPAENTTNRAPGLPQRPCPPTGGHQLSTIQSVETLKEINQQLQAEENFPGEVCGLKRKLTTHEDLMSVLSLPRGSRARRSRRNARTAQTKPPSSSAQEILATVVADEEKYGRELRTLVDGVIPVLLQCLLSKTDAAAAAGLFTSASQDGASITRPIIDMGIALERLKALHNRIPSQNLDSLLSWAQTSEKAYRDYLQAWRLGFQDVVVNLAPLETSSAQEQGMARDEAGDLVDDAGKKVDVAYLLKRPLVRVKGLSKTFNRIKDEYDVPLAVQMANTFADLTALAKRRNQEEQARLEDEAAANIDATRARDIRSMAASTHITINKTRRVRARDVFNLTIYHSSGQRMDCSIELIFRDNARGEPTGGDVLVCEIDDTGKWLLFAPIELNSISARRGEDGFDLVLMIRGRAGIGQEWHELLALKTDDKEAVAEWMDMLGSNPLPPRLNRTPSFVRRPLPLVVGQAAAAESSASKPITQQVDKSSATATEYLDVPIGEPSVLGTRREDSRPLVDRSSQRLNLGGGLASKPLPPYPPSSSIPKRRPVSVPSVLSSDRSTISDRSIRDSATIFTSSSSKTASTNPSYLSSQSKSPEAWRPPQPPSHKPLVEARDHVESSKNAGLQKLSAPVTASSGYNSPSTSHEAWKSRASATEPASGDSQHSLPAANSDSSSSKPSVKPSPQRPEYHRAVSSTPSKDLPTVNKLRTQQGPASPLPSLPVRQPPETQSSAVASEQPQQRSKREHKGSPRSRLYTEDIPVPPVLKTRQDRPSLPSFGTSSPPTSPPHSSNVLQPISSNRPSPILRPTPSPADKAARRRTSSPLKHEYEPSTSSDTSGYDSDSDSSSSSDTSEDPLSEHGDIPTPLVAIRAGEGRTAKQSAPPPSMKSTGTRTLAPSDSASQGPYRKVPSSTTIPSDKKAKTIALICSWSDKGMWEQIYPDECSIVVSPGLIEAFEMSAAHSDPQKASVGPSFDSHGPGKHSVSPQPLVAFELTPIVPLRRGTALDISIRSPPTANSKIRTTNNVMFRSRNPEECEALYGMINWARCNNPTYLQLQNARPRRQPSVTFNVGEAQHSRSRSTSWFSFGSQKKSSYRASSAPTPASIDMSVESSGTVTSAFSALKRLGVSTAFNLNRSSVLRRNGGRGTGESLYSSSSGTGTGSGSGTPPPSQLGFIPGKDGPNVPSTSAAAAEGGGMVNNMKIRLYVRKGQHWENLGAARLTVLPVPSAAAAAAESSKSTPNRPVVTPGASPPPPTGPLRSPSNVAVGGQLGQTRGPRLPSSSHTPHRVHGNGREKRILITQNKNRDVVLLDSVLGESCFERVMQTGIAVKTWSEDEVIAHTGGVTLGKERVYMMQFPGTREAGWVFGLCGTYRYGVGANE
ncbi:hypothetical protein AYL99_00379 [Fonsecaea erecta]|uniref:EXPERA domain-containing protein n=1 Tax=Fonsecaea erecta TaxID=1367422 RepID=A0A178ZXI6_9EURO|nr:hypothetical protein AYL99_00379 [Fonsecaea erecta]OAP64407.1 hypothetical protein AYL99_00379 [Fonsecaea erecta]